MNLLIKFIITLIAIANTSFANEVVVFDFKHDEISKLEVRKVRGADNKTIYTLGSKENGNFLKAVAENAASGLGKQLKIDLNKTPFINITWKVEKDLAGIKENTKKGHDFAARVFVIKKTGATPLSNRAINYVFSSNNEIGFNSPSPYKKKSIDNVLSSTKQNLNEWVTVKANVKEDFKKFHNLDVNDLDGDTLARHKNREIEPGEEIKFKVKDIVSDTKITLTQRDDVELNPWLEINKKFKVPSEVEATVKTCKDYGLFVELEEGIVGLLHVSEIGEDNIKKYRPKQTINVLITKIEEDTKKIFLKLPNE